MKQYLIAICMLFVLACSSQNIPATVSSKPISQVPQETTINDNDLLLIVKNGLWRKVTGLDAKKSIAPYVAQNSLAYLPTPTGNTINKNVIFKSSIDGKVYYISHEGNSIALSDGGSGKTYLPGAGITITNTNVINAKDTSTTNELQNLSLMGSAISISNGNTINLVNYQDNTYYVGCGTSGYTVQDNVKTVRVCRDPSFGNTGKLIVLPNAASTIAGTDKTIALTFNTAISGLVDVTISSDKINTVPIIGGSSFNATSVILPKDVQSITFVNVDTRWEATNIIRAKLIAGTGITIGTDNVITASGTSTNLANSNLTQTTPHRIYTMLSSDTLAFKGNGRVNIEGGLSVQSVNNPILLRSDNVVIGTSSVTGGTLQIGGGLYSQTSIWDGVTNGNSNGKWLKSVDNVGHAVWTDLPTPPSGIAGVTASQGLSSQIVSGMPDIQLGGNPTAVAVTNQRGLNLGANGSLVFNNIQLTAGSGQKRDALVITNDNNAISGGDGDDIGVKFDIADNISRLAVSDERLSLLTNKATTLGTESTLGNGTIYTQAGSVTIHQNNSTSNSDLVISGNSVRATAYAAPRNDAGTPLRVASFDNFGNLQAHDVGELPFQSPIAAGPGINIVGNTISAFDSSPTNELQTISKTGSTITLSNGGGSVTDSDNQTATQVTYTPISPITGTDVASALNQLTALLASGSKTVITLNPYADNQLIDYSTTFGQNTPAAGLPIPTHLIGKKITEVGCKIGWLSNVNPMTSYIQVWDASGVKFSQAVSCAVNGAKVTIASPYTLVSGEYLQLVVGSQAGSTVNKGLSAFYTIE